MSAGLSTSFYKWWQVSVSTSYGTIRPMHNMRTLNLYVTVCRNFHSLNDTMESDEENMWEWSNLKTTTSSLMRITSPRNRIALHYVTLSTTNNDFKDGAVLPLGAYDGSDGALKHVPECCGRRKRWRKENVANSVNKHRSPSLLREITQCNVNEFLLLPL